MSDLINNPAHYNQLDATCDNCKGKIECIEVVRHTGFNLGNAIKYIWRCEHKGNKLQDLKKAVWYLQDEIKKTEEIVKHESSLRLAEKAEKAHPAKGNYRPAKYQDGASSQGAVE